MWSRRFRLLVLGTGGQAEAPAPHGFACVQKFDQPLPHGRGSVGSRVQSRSAEGTNSSLLYLRLRPRQIQQERGDLLPVVVRRQQILLVLECVDLILDLFLLRNQFPLGRIVYRRGRLAIPDQGERGRML